MKEITRSYQRKIQLENYGGKKYESVDIFAAYKQADIPDEEKNLEKISEELYQFSKKDVERSIAQLENELRGEPFSDNNELVGAKGSPTRGDYLK